MAKVSLNKITPIKDIDPKIITIEDNKIEVIQYLPITDKLALVEKVLNLSLDPTGFFNPVRLEIYTNLEIIRTYSNVSITDKMMENAAKTYDLLTMNNIINTIIMAIPEEEYATLLNAIEECTQATLQYMTSFVGMVKTIAEDYKNSKMNVDDIMKTLNSPNEIGLLKEILEKVG